MNNHRHRHTAFILVAFFLGILIGLFFNKLHIFKEKQEEPLYLKYMPTIAGDFTKPLLEINTVRSDDSTILLAKQRIEKYINGCVQKNYASKISVYLMDLNTRSWTGVNENETYAIASLLKTTVMIAYFKKEEEDPSVLQKTISCGIKNEMLPQNVPPENSVQLGSTHTIDDLIRYMIVYSDNAAMEILLENIDEDFLEKLRLDLQLPPIISNNIDRQISPKQFATPLQVLYNATYLHKSSSEKALKLLSQTGFTDGIVAGVPPGIVIAHKFAERVYMPENIRQLHDCGIVYASKGPYLICIMTSGWDFKELKSIIQNISRIAYSCMENRKIS